jgi:hypothetical protein
VRTRVGVIDVSTLGKFRVKGPEAVQLLERLYPAGSPTSAIGRIRYGLMLNDEGVIAGRRDRRPDRRRRVLRHRHHREHRGARTVDHVVERRLGSRRPRPETSRAPTRR